MVRPRICTAKIQEHARSIPKATSGLTAQGQARDATLFPAWLDAPDASTDAPPAMKIKTYSHCNSWYALPFPIFG
eukprot:6699806-Pyramimonas_sp.AAC.1